MAESIQHKLDRVRSPRVQITYDVEIGEAIEARELPFLMGLMADLSGKPKTALPKLKERKFVEIDRDNINEVMASYKPRIATFVEDKLSKSGGKLGVELNFKSMDDFDPLSVVKQVPVMAELYATRVRLNDLLGKMDGNEELEELLNKIMKDSKVRDEIKKVAAGKNAATDKVLKEGKLMRDESQRDFATALLQEFVTQLTKDKVTSADSLSCISKKIQQIDTLLTGQLNEIMHSQDFQTLEGSWRGLNYLVMKTETGRLLKLRVLNITKKELLNDLERAVEFDQSQLFKKVYEEEYGTFGGTPYSCLLGDYEFGRHPQDMALLEKISLVAAAAHAPFMTAASPALFDLDSYTQMGVPRDLTKIFENTELIKWNSF